MAYSDVQGGWMGPGNIDIDPLFVDPANGDLRHNAATRLRREHGIDIAQTILGHRLGSHITEIYAEANVARRST